MSGSVDKVRGASEISLPPSIQFEDVKKAYLEGRGYTTLIHAMKDGSQEVKYDVSKRQWFIGESVVNLEASQPKSNIATKWFRKVKRHANLKFGSRLEANIQKIVLTYNSAIQKDQQERAAEEKRIASEKQAQEKLQLEKEKKVKDLEGKLFVVDEKLKATKEELEKVKQTPQKSPQEDPIEKEITTKKEELQRVQDRVSLITKFIEKKKQKFTLPAKPSQELTKLLKDEDVKALKGKKSRGHLLEDCLVQSKKLSNDIINKKQELESVRKEHQQKIESQKTKITDDIEKLNEQREEILKDLGKLGVAKEEIVTAPTLQSTERVDQEEPQLSQEQSREQTSWMFKLSDDDTIAFGRLEQRERKEILKTEQSRGEWLLGQRGYLKAYQALSDEMKILARKLKDNDLKLFFDLKPNEKELYFAVHSLCEQASHQTLSADALLLIVRNRITSWKKVGNGIEVTVADCKKMGQLIGINPNLYIKLPERLKLTWDTGSQSLNFEEGARPEFYAKMGFVQKKVGDLVASRHTEEGVKVQGEFTSIAKSQGERLLGKTFEARKIFKFFSVINWG